MVDELRLWAISIHLVRQCFAAPADLAAILENVTDSLAPASTPAPSRGLLSKLGPLTRRPPDAPVIRHDVPNRVDAATMMTSRFIASDRLPASWILLRAWLDRLAAAGTVIPLPRDTIDATEFDLACAGVPSHVSIRHLWHNSLDIPLRPVGNMSVGYMDHATANSLVGSWTAALPELHPPTLEFTAPFLQFATVFTNPDTAPLDLVAWWTYC